MPDLSSEPQRRLRHLILAISCAADLPPCVVLRFRDAVGRVPFDDWLSALVREAVEQRALERIGAAVGELRRSGHDLRRPLSAPLRDGVHELRLASGRVQYRILYFFAGPGIAVLSHGCTKERRVPEAEIERALLRRSLYLAHPARHTA